MEASAAPMRGRFSKKTPLKELLSSALKVPTGFRFDRRTTQSTMPEKSISINHVALARGNGRRLNVANAKPSTPAPLIKELAVSQNIVPTTPILSEALETSESGPQPSGIISGTFPAAESSSINKRARHGRLSTIPSNANEEDANSAHIEPNSPITGLQNQVQSETRDDLRAVAILSANKEVQNQETHQEQLSSSGNVVSMSSTALIPWSSFHINDSTRLSYGMNIPVNSPSLQRRKKGLYIGLLPEWPAPKAVEDQWVTLTQARASLQERLMFDLINAVQKKLGRIESDRENIEVELRMVGYATRKSSTVDLKPTILVRCRTKKCRKALREAVSDITYLPQRLNNDAVTIKLHAPQPASLQMRQSNTAERHGLSTGEIAGLAVGITFSILGLVVAFLQNRYWKRTQSTLSYDVEPHVRRTRRNSKETPDRYTGLPDPGPMIEPNSEYRDWGSMSTATRPAPRAPPVPRYVQLGSTLDGSTVDESTTIGSNPGLTGFSSWNAEIHGLPREVPQPFFVPSQANITMDRATGSLISDSSRISRALDTEKYLREYTDVDSPPLDSQYSGFIQANAENLACGLKYKWIFKHQNGQRGLVSRIGGFLRIDDDLWGLTTAHSVLTATRRVASETSGSLTILESSSKTEQELDSDCSTEDDEEQAEGVLSGEVPAAQFIAEAAAIDQIVPQEAAWTSIDGQGPIGFANWSHIPGQPISFDPLTKGRDFALINLDALHKPPLNAYQTPANNKTSTPTVIDGILNDDSLTPGPILVLDEAENHIEGYLLPGRNVLSMFNQVFYTRKLRLKTPLGTGSSGSWVVRDRRFCGYIVAVYEHEPFAHIITAEKLFFDIITTLQRAGLNPQILRVATAEDVETLSKAPYDTVKLPERRRSAKHPMML